VKLAGRDRIFPDVAAKYKIIYQLLRGWEYFPDGSFKIHADMPKAAFPMNATAVFSGRANLAPMAKPSEAPNGVDFPQPI